VKRKTQTTPLGMKLRTFAAGYAATGQRERADGLAQAADAVDEELSHDPMAALRDLVGVVATVAERLEEVAADLTSAALTLAGERSLKRVVDAAAPRTERARRVRPAEKQARGERRVLTAIAQHSEGVTREQLSVLTGYKRSSRDTYLQRLLSTDLVFRNGDRVVASGKGLAELGPDFRPLPTGSALREHWLARLPEGERRILSTVLERGGMHREALSDATGYKRSSRDTYLQKLRARKLVDVEDSGIVVPSPSLFD
jgi:hypothetical protein